MTQIRSMAQPVHRRPGELGVHSLDHFNFVVPDVAQAEKFYEVHKARPFYGDLVRFMTSGPIVVQVLQGENAVKTYRDVMGATDPAKAAAGTIRKELAESIERNSVHGSDSAENAAAEIALNFKAEEVVG